MTDYEQHINNAEDHFHTAQSKIHSDEGIVFALLGIGEVLLAREKREDKNAPTFGQYEEIINALSRLGG